jgi:NADH-quinone oxidoreductase subunit F
MPYTATHPDPLMGAQRRVILCAGTGCVANGALDVFAAFQEQMQARRLPFTLELKAEEDNHEATAFTRSGCQGFCQMGPLVTILPENILYTQVGAEDVEEIIDTSLICGGVVDRLLYTEPGNGHACTGPDDIPFYTRQQRFVLGECGIIDPESLDEYLRIGGYEGARKAMLKMAPEEICNEITESGLRGRGGSGYPTGIKWETASKQVSDKKYVICNADEGDPGAFMNRSVMEGNPHCVIEGLMIAARAIGADRTLVYVRAEYPLAVERLRRAVKDALERGILGENVFGTGCKLTCEIMEGAGAFVCGEETAMIASIEGQRGMPRPKPPYPAQSGLWGKPTIINNVETLAHAVRIVREGAGRFRELGTPTSPGTKTFALTGHVANTGLIEVPFGTTLREIVYNIGGGVARSDGSIDPAGFKAVQIGGPSGGCLTSDHLELSLDFDSLKSVGAMVGSGGLVVMNQDTCMVSVARFFMEFTQRESCGKCVLCREGTQQMLAMMDDIIEGRADGNTIPLLKELGHAVQKGSLCGLGKTAPNPVLSTLHYFPEEYEAHVHDKVCPAGQCKALIKPSIDPAKCKGCVLCAQKCPVEAISGEKKKPHVIDEAKCIKCGVCAETCKFDAVIGF